MELTKCVTVRSEEEWERCFGVFGIYYGIRDKRREEER